MVTNVSTTCDTGQVVSISSVAASRWCALEDCCGVTLRVCHVVLIGVSLASRSTGECAGQAIESATAQIGVLEICRSSPTHRLQRDRIPVSAREPASHWPRDQSLAAIERPHQCTLADPCRIAECHLGTVVVPEYPCARGRNAGLVKCGGHQILATSAEMPPSSCGP